MLNPTPLYIGAARAFSPPERQLQCVVHERDDRPGADALVLPAPVDEGDAPSNGRRRGASRRPHEAGFVPLGQWAARILEPTL